MTFWSPTFNASPSLPPRSADLRRHRLVMSLAARQCATLLLLACLTIPDAVLHAKFYKMNMILWNMHRHYFGQTAS